MEPSPTMLRGTGVSAVTAHLTLLANQHDLPDPVTLQADRVLYAVGVWLGFQLRDPPEVVRWAKHLVSGQRLVFSVDSKTAPRRVKVSARDRIAGCEVEFWCHITIDQYRQSVFLPGECLSNRMHLVLSPTEVERRLHRAEAVPDGA